MAKVIKQKIVTKLTPLEKLWDQAEERSKVLIDRILQGYIPVDWRPQDLDLEKSTNWRVIARDDVPSLYEDYTYDEEGDELKEIPEEFPDADYLAEQIAYHYLLTLLKGIISDLADYDCHDPAYFEQLFKDY